MLSLPCWRRLPQPERHGAASSRLLGGFLNLLLDLVRDLVLVVQLNCLVHGLGGQFACRGGQRAQRVLDADVLVQGHECLRDSIGELGDAVNGITAFRLLLLEGLGDGVAHLARHSVLVIHVGAEVESLQAARGNALQGRRNVVVLFPGEVGRRREERAADPDAAHEQPSEAAEHARGRHGVLLRDLHQGDGAARGRGRGRGRGSPLAPSLYVQLDLKRRQLVPGFPGERLRAGRVGVQGVFAEPRLASGRVDRIIAERADTSSQRKQGKPCH
mmetsp:Transcript_55223/g.142228  ORF Transcript_55223/g.142228 Transcript_55223/m.142228 type:complete len:273 (+) Transcript_55223:93-911(+)